MELYDPTTSSGQAPATDAGEEDVYVFPVSFAQQRMWFLNQMDPDTAAYNVSAPVELLGPLDVEALERTIREIVRRHEALRTRFAVRDGEVVQIVSPSVRVDFRIEDVGWEEVGRRAGEEGRRVFDLGRGPLVRALLLRGGEERHALVLSMHHIVSDGWSVGVLTREMAALYDAYTRGGESPLPELEVQYADYAVWQREWLRGEALERQLAYWRERLAGAPLVVELPTRGPRPPLQTFRGGMVGLRVGAETAGRLVEVGRSLGATPFMVLLGVFAVVLARHTGQRDVVVGTPIAGRTRSQLEALIGFFVNTLALRVGLEGRPSFAEVVGRVREATLGAYEHQELPFERLVEELKVERDLSRNPVVQVLFALQNAPGEAMGLRGVEARRMEGTWETVRFDLEVHVWEEEGGGFEGQVVYNADLFERSAMERLAGHIERVAESASREPGAAALRLRMLGEEEERRAVEEWQESGRREYERVSVQELVRRAAARKPEAEAVVCGGERVSYGELERRAGRLARRLREAGVGVESRVGLMVGRGVGMVVGMLGVLKAGGAYVPVEGRWPAERIGWVFADAGVEVVVAERSEAGSVVEGVRVVWLEEEGSEEGGCYESEEVVAENLAYVLYTSGSTGVPKGVGVEQASASALVQWAGERFGEEGLRSVVASTSACFDLSVFEVFGTLGAGGKVVVAENALGLGAAAEGEDVVLVNTVPSAMRELVRSRAVPESVRVVCLAGEALSRGLVREVYEGTRAEAVWNLYGPTEDTTYTTWEEVRREEEGEVAIGRGVGGKRVYVLDEELEVVPVGVVGEIYTAGVGVARGYVGQAGRTAERFVADVYGKAGGRMYRTGDLGRYREDGRIEYVGRRDRQVKVRGYRIEPGEIEERLREHPLVREAAVLVRDRAADRSLLAFIVPDRERVDDATARGLATDQLTGWQDVFDGYVSGAAQAPSDPLFNTAGWVSSYDGNAIPDVQMRVWAADVVSEVLALRPRHVLEIGCGTGMLAFQIAPHVERYTGVDASQSAVDYVNARVAENPGLANVTASRRRADELDDLEPGAFDVVLLSSVVQYFPDVEYFARVVETAVRAVRPGGAVVVADVRSLQLMRVCHASIELRRAGASLSTGELRRRLERRAEQESELFLDPRIFAALRHRIPAVASARVRLEAGAEHNELNKFRYTAVLRVGEAASSAPEVERIDARAFDLDDVRRIASERRATAVFEGLSNARVAEDVRAVVLLAASEVATVGELLAACVDGRGVDPAALAGLAREIGFRVECRPSLVDAARFDAIFYPGSAGVPPACGPEARAPGSDPVRDEKPLAAYANDPLRARRASALVAGVRERLASVLPGYMMPSSFVVLDALPLTPNGKVDHAALLAYREAAPPSAEGKSAPETDLERKLSAIVEEALEIERAGVTTNFFDLGATSLRIVRIQRRIQEALGVEVPIVEMFRNPTVRSLAAFLGAERSDDEALRSVAEQARKRKAERQRRLSRRGVS